MLIGPCTLKHAPPPPPEALREQPDANTPVVAAELPETSQLARNAEAASSIATAPAELALLLKN